MRSWQRFFMIFLGLAVLVGNTGPTQAAEAGSGSPARVALVLARKDYSVAQFQDLQKALNEKRIAYEVVSIALGQAQSSGHTVNVDHKLTDLELERYAAVVFLGGTGAFDDLYDNQTVIQLMQRAAKQGKIIGGS